jgi:hypothetical protein
VFATRVMTNPPMTMEIDLASDGENGALDSEDSGTSYPRIWYHAMTRRLSHEATLSRQSGLTSLDQDTLDHLIA